MARIAVVHYIGATARSRSVVASLLADLVDEGHKVELLDISRFSVISQDLPRNLVARILGHKVFDNKFEETLAGLGVRHVLIGPASTAKPEATPELGMDARQAIDSELLTYFRRPSLIPETGAISAMRKNLTSMALATYSALSGEFDKSPPDLVLIPNGRTSRQKVARVVADERKIPVNFYENGRASKDSYYRGTTQPHDRVASQREVEPLVAHLSEKEIHRLARDWLDERMSPSSGTNTFSSLWTPEHTKRNQTPPAETKSAIFFTSSADEFLAFGPMWDIDEWESQFHAFDLVMGQLASEGVMLRLRIHPNLTGKSRKYFKDTIKNVLELGARHPGLRIDWPNSQENSYDLAAEADYVIAERSTIGLEANLMGKPVWVNQASQWDLVADVRQFLKPADVSKEALSPWTVDIRGAEKFVAYWMIQEKPLRFTWRDWSTWNPEKAPTRMKLALLSVKNPWSHRWHLLLSEWHRWLNSRFRKPKGWLDNK